MSAIIDCDFAPILDAESEKPMSKWDGEKRAFDRLLPGLLADGHEGKYVAIHEGDIVGIGDDKFALADDAYSRFGYQAILVREIAKQLRIVRIPSVRVRRAEGK